jgi:ABC-type Fe3+ transport system permease subunit
MKMTLRPLAAAEMLLVAPAALFMTALFVRNLQPEQYEPAHTAARFVALFASSTRIGLWLLLIALPLLVLVIGSVVLARAWGADSELRHAAHQAVAAVRAHLAAFFIACATASAFVILAIVALHLITD